MFKNYNLQGFLCISIPSKLCYFLLFCLQLFHLVHLFLLASLVFTLLLELCLLHNDLKSNSNMTSLEDILGNANTLRHFIRHEPISFACAILIPVYLDGWLECFWINSNQSSLREIFFHFFKCNIRW